MPYVKNTKFQGFTANNLKLLAMTTMLIDHVAWKFLPFASAGGLAAHLIGRITIPVFCYFAAEGYFHTRSFKKYICRMLLFAFISNFAFYFYANGRLQQSALELANSFVNTSVILPLTLGLVALRVYYHENFNTSSKAVLITLCAAGGFFGDWFFFPVIWILGFGIFRGHFKKQAAYFILTGLPIMVFESFYRYFYGIGDELWALNQFGIILALPLLYFYNGKLGKYKLKWLFYVFYPAHLVVLALINNFIKL